MTQVTRRQRQREERLELFTDVAEKLFLEKGYENTTIEEIARNAEFSKRAVYLYFNDKHELFSAVLLRGLERLRQRIHSARDAHEPGRDRLLAMARAYGHAMLEQPAFFELVMRFERYDFHYRKRGDEFGPFGQRCLAVNDELGELLNEAIRRAQAEGALDTNLEPPQFTLMTWSALAGVLQVGLWRRPLLPEVYGMTAEELFEEAVERLLPPPEPSPKQDGNP